MDNHVRDRFIEQLSLWFLDNDAGFRRFVGSLRDDMRWRTSLPGSGASVPDLVERALDLIHNEGLWPAIAPRFFMQLSRELEGRREHIERWQRYVMTAQSPDGQHHFAVVLVHLGESTPQAVADELVEALGISRAAALQRTVPSAEIAGGLGEQTALDLGRQLERIGAVVSYRSPPHARPLPCFRRTVSGCVLARIPPTDDMEPAGGEPGPFWLMRVPVTRSLFAEVMHDGRQRPAGDRRPAGHVSRDDALAFCEALSGRERLRAIRYRLPTEAEWMFAARARAGTRYPGSNQWHEVAFAVDGSETQPVGRRRANRWGLHDLSGNVWEWVADLEPDPRGSPNGVLKGGCFDSPESQLEPTARRLWPPQERDPAHGLRVALSISTAADDDDDPEPKRESR